MPLVSVVQPRFSFSELQLLPEDGPRYELYDGELVIVPAPILLHQRVALRVYDVLSEYERAHGGLVAVSPLDIVFDEYNVLQPDVVFFVRERRALLDLRKPIRVPPDVTVEILSPSTSHLDRGRKMQMYAREGVREYWVIDPNAQAIEIYRSSDGIWTLAQRAEPASSVESTVLDGLRFDPARLFDV
jgi:Uma2 family endonuclease